MDSSGTRSRTRWQFGLHPAAAGLVVRSIVRVEFPVGDALRVEMADPGTADSPAADVVHLQYHVVTASGGWALWISATPDELREAEERLPELVTPAEEDPSA
jgi:hypothetical protein